MHLFFVARTIYVPGNYSWLIAPAGHPSAQAPHSMHVSASITYCPSPSLIAPAGQVPSQAPQEIQASEITYAIVIILLNCKYVTVF